MGQKLSPADASLYRAVSDVLLHDWDPCNVSDVPEAQDEYHGYVPQVFRLVREGAGPEVIGDHLHRIETERMGSTTERYKLDPVAEKLSGLGSGRSARTL